MERLSNLAARMGTDPTAIIGRAQTLFRYDALEGGKRTNNLVARVDVPYKDFLLRVDMPYIWTDPNRPGVSSENGLSDLFVRTGRRLYSVQGNAIFAGMDFTFPTAENAQVGSGKYTVGPAVATAHVFPQLSSLVFTLLQHQISVGGDPSRQAISVLNLQVFFNTIWTDRWWTRLEAVTQVDWERKATNSMTLEFEAGHRFTQDWGCGSGQESGSGAGTFQAPMSGISRSVSGVCSPGFEPGGPSLLLRQLHDPARESK